MYPLKQSTAVTLAFFAHDVNGDGVTGMVDGGFTKRISKGGGAFAAMTVTVSEMENGWYSIPLSTSHTDTLGVLTISLSNASCKRVNLQFRVDARVPDDLAYPATSGRSLGVDASGRIDLGSWLGASPLALTSQRVEALVGAMAAGVVTAAAVATDAIDNDAIAANAVTEIQSGLATSAALATAQSDLDDIQTRLPAALVSGRIDASVGAMAAGVVTAAAVATDAIDNDAIAANAITEIQAGLATAAALATVQADTDDIQTRLPAALVGGRMDALVGAMANDVLTAAAIAASAITSSEAPALANLDAAVSTRATAAMLSDVHDTVDDVHNDIGTIQADTDNIQTRLPAALVSGRMDASIGAMGASVLTAAAFAAGAIDANALANDAAEEIALKVLTWASSNWESAAGVKSLGAAVMKAVHRIRDNAGTLQIFRSDGATVHASQTVTTDDTLKPIDELSGAA